MRRTFDILKAKAIMQATGKSYADLGRALGLERQAVGHWFRERGEPSVQQMKLMAKELGCHWLELVDERATVIYDDAEITRIARARSLTPEELEEMDRWLEAKTAKLGNS